MLSARTRSVPNHGTRCGFIGSSVSDNPHRVNGELLPSAYCIQPQQSPELHYGPKDRCVSISFTVAGTQLEQVPDKRAVRLSARAPVQPDPQTVWGVDLPLVLPESLWSWTLTRLRLIAGIWWRSDRDHFKANMRLIEVLEHIADVFRKAHSTEESDAEALPWSGTERAVEGRIAQLQTVADLAAIAGMSVAHFSRQFHSIFAVPPAQWLRQRRLEAAAHLLRSTEQNVRVIAENVGFRSETVFYQVWKKYYTSTPSEWRHQRLGR